MALTKHFYMGGHTLSSAIHKGIDLEEKEEEEALICHVSFAAQCNSFDCASPLLDSWCQRWYGTSLSERASSLAKGFSRLILVVAGAETLTFWSNRTQTIRASLSLGSRSNKKEGGLLMQVDIKTSTQPCLWHTCDYWKCLKITVYSVFAPVTVITGISSLWAPLLWIITFHSSPLLPTFFALLFSFYLFFHSTFVFATQSIYFSPILIFSVLFCMLLNTSPFVYIILVCLCFLFWKTLSLPLFPVGSQKHSTRMWTFKRIREVELSLPSLATMNLCPCRQKRRWVGMTLYPFDSIYTGLNQW